MKLKSLLLWVVILGLLAGLGWLYAVNQKQEAELAVLRQDSQQLQKLRAEQEEAGATRAKAESDELTRLRKDSEELRRLRNEVGQLRTARQQLATQVQQAQAQAQGAQAQVEALRANVAQPRVPGQPGVAAAAPTAQPGQPPLSPEQAQAAACINNLRLIDGAKQQWALEKHKPAGALLTAADLAPYLKGNTMPVCPAGGVYTLNPVGVTPICNIPGHAVK
jgi:Tfp pilus assembly protein FimV